MNKILISALAAVAVFAVTATTLAQDAGPKQGPGKGQQGRGAQAGRGKWMQDVLKQLNLTDDQKKKLADLQKGNAEKMKKMREEMKGNPGAGREKMMAMRKENEDAMKKILSKDQWAKYEKLRKEAMDKARKEGGGKRGGGNIPPTF
jgi:Spy/CpxP family protein refolding chaperone